MKKIIPDTTNPKNNHKETDIIFKNNKESQNMINNMNYIHTIIMKNQGVSEQNFKKILNNIREDFNNSQFDIYEEIVDIKFIEKHGEEIEQNKDIWQEILDGNFKNHRKLTFLIPSVALALSQFKEMWLSLSDLQSINKDIALTLIQFQGMWISLNGLQSINEDIAIALSQFQGQRLFLEGLQSMNKEIAMALSMFQGKRLFLNGLQSIDKDSALALAQLEGKLYVSDEIQKQIDLYVEENNIHTT
jgi:hypothetical protein